MFTYVYDNKGEIPAVEEFTVGSSAVVVGQPLKLSSGVLVDNNSATAKPTFISNANAASGAKCPVIRITPVQQWRTVLASAFTPVVGTKYTLGGDNKDEVTSTTTNGIAEVVEVLGSAAGSPVVVCFS